MHVWLYALLSVVVVSTIPLAIVLILPRDPARLARIVPSLVSFAVGGLLGGAILHLIPESVERLGTGPAMSVSLIGGFLGFFLLERFLWTHEHESEVKEPRGRKHLVAMNLIGDGVHNVIDGMVIAAAFSADPALGLSTTLAVILHEVPQEVGDFGILLYGGLTYKKAVLFNFLSGLTAILGALLTLTIGERVTGFATVLLPIAAGNFIYIAAADLIPELHRERGAATAIRQAIFVIAGIGLMALTMLMD